MCLGVPMLIVSISGNLAEAEAAGVRRTVGIDLLDEVEVGDHVIVHAGFAIQILDEDEAQLRTELIEEVLGQAQGGGTGD